MIKPWPAEKYQEPPDDTFQPEPPPILVPAAAISSVLETLNLLDEFFRHYASPTTRTELHAFAALRGWDPTQGAQLIIEGIGFDALSLTRARDTTDANQK